MEKPSLSSFSGDDFFANQEDFMAWKHIPRQWPFRKGNWSHVYSSHKGQYGNVDLIVHVSVLSKVGLPGIWDAMTPVWRLS